jgi:hypothetical protein
MGFGGLELEWAEETGKHARIRKLTFQKEQWREKKRGLKIFKKTLKHNFKT